MTLPDGSYSCLYFGDWSAPVTDNGLKVPVPIDTLCSWCDVPIDPDSHGRFLSILDLGGVQQKPVHKECDLRSVVGSVKHLEGKCTCHGGDADDVMTRPASVTSTPSPPGITGPPRSSEVRGVGAVAGPPVV